MLKPLTTDAADVIDLMFVEIRDQDLVGLCLQDMGRGVPDTELDRIEEEQFVNEACVLVYTSGTTGKPKGVMVNQVQLIKGRQSKRIPQPNFSFRKTLPTTCAAESSTMSLRGVSTRESSINGISRTLYD